MKKTDLAKGQSYLKDNEIVYAEKSNIFDLDMDEYTFLFSITGAKDFEELSKSDEYYRYILNKYKKAYVDSDTDIYDFRKPERIYFADTYNARLYDYPTGQHVTLYNNPIPIGKKNVRLSKSYKNEQRTADEEKHCIDVSLNRTKNAIYNIARSNVWKWFITLTLNPDKVDRSSYDEVVKKLQKFCNNLQQRHCPNLKYLIVPELHDDGINYHFHGLLAGCDELDFLFSGKFDKKGRPVFNIPQWTYGFTTATLVGDTSRASSYITKYVTKESEQYLKNKHRYYTNRNTCRTSAEKLVVDDAVDFIRTYIDDITYMKDVTVKPAYRKCTYLEMPHNVPVIKHTEIISPDNSEYND